MAANILSDVRVPVLTVVCEPCGRRDRHDVESLKQQHGGDVKMPDLLAALVADCPKTRSFTIYDRCKAVYEKRGGGRVPSSAPLLAKGDAIELIRASLPEAGKLPQIIGRRTIPDNPERLPENFGISDRSILHFSQAKC